MNPGPDHLSNDFLANSKKQWFFPTTCCQWCLSEKGGLSQSSFWTSWPIKGCKVRHITATRCKFGVGDTTLRAQIGGW